MKILVMVSLAFTTHVQAAWRDKLMACYQYLTEKSYLSKKSPQYSWLFSGARLDDNVYSYNSYFQEVLNGKTFERLALERIKAGHTSHLADLFGAAIFSSQPESFSSLTGFRLSTLYAFQTPAVYKGYQHRGEVAGNVYSESSWERLDENMRSREISAFDIVVVRPLADLPDNASPKLIDSYLQVVKNIWTRLSASDGILLAQIPGSARDNAIFRAWLQRTKGNGVTLKMRWRDGFYRSYISLLKTEDSPTAIP